MSKKTCVRMFTLLEMVIVIAVLGILASLLLPSLRDAREKSRLTVCQSNLKQIGVGALIWSSQNDEWTASKNWSHPSLGGNNQGSLKPYTGTHRDKTRDSFSGLYHCPSLTRAHLEGTVSQNYEYTSYAINGRSMVVGDEELSRLRGKSKLSQVEKPYRKVYFAERGSNAIYSDAFTYTTTKSPTRWHPPLTGVYGKTNILWFDGHVSIEPGDFVSRGDYWDYYFDLLFD